MQESLSCLAGIFSLSYSYYLNTFVAEQRKQFDYIKYSKRYSIEELSSDLFQKQTKGTEIKNIIIEGVANSKSSLKSFFSDKRLVYQEIRRIPLYSNNYLFQGLHGRRGNTNKGHLISKNLTNLELYSINNDKNNKFCQIDRDSLEIPYETLEEIGMQTIKLPNLSLFENILVFLGVILESICFFYIPSNLTNGIFIGYSDKELGIRTGGMLSLIGDLVYNHENGSFILKKAKFTEIALKELEKQLTWNRVKLALGIGMGLGFLIYPLIRIYKRYKAKNLHPSLQKDLSQSANYENIEKIFDDEENLCIICCERNRSILPKPCLHLSCCKTCFRSLKKKECPICRIKIEGFTEICIQKTKSMNKNVQDNEEKKNFFSKN